MKRASSYVVAAACLLVAAPGSLRQAESQPAAANNASASLDYEFFKTKVQPVFLTKRPGHTRCVVCHTTNNARFHLVRLSPGSTTWTEEQARQNFQLIQRVAIPGSLDSPIVHHPLAEQAGGDFHHGGGPQFESQQDPAWQTLRAFVLGQKT
jgi:hypothetical protein